MIEFLLLPYEIFMWSIKWIIAAFGWLFVALGLTYVYNLIADKYWRKD